MSGVEVAGLVLGAIPLIVEALKIYAKGVSTASRYLKYQNHLQDLYRELEIEGDIYLNTCEQLLEGLVEDAIHRVDLLDNPGGEAWRDNDLEEKLRNRLNRSYNSYVQIMEDMRAAVEKIEALLKLGPDGKVKAYSYHPETLRYLVQFLSNSQVQVDGSSKFREEYHRLNFSMKKKDYDGLVARIARNNEKLSRLTDQNRSLEASRCTSSSKIPDFKTIQTYASHLFNLLSSGLQCGCPTTHSINLKLEDRIQRSAVRSGPFTETLPPYQVAVSYGSKLPIPERAPWIFEALDGRPFTESPSGNSRQPKKPKKSKKSVTFAVKAETTISSTVDTILKHQNALPIGNICHTMPRIQSMREGDYIGVLEDKLMNHKMAVFQASYFVQRPSKPSFRSLSSIISSNRVGNAPFSWSDKLRIAVVMASSLLQLYHTPWLNETWGKEDISLLEGCSSEIGILNQLFISKPYGVEEQRWYSDDVARNGWDVIRNRPLFALGILLIELCVGKPFEAIRKEKLGSLPTDSGSAALDLAAADQMVEICYRERGPRYGDAVRRCIHCSFDTRKTDLEDAQFRQAVYNGVVAPLGKDLENFDGHNV